MTRAALRSMPPATALLGVLACFEDPEDIGLEEGAGSCEVMDRTDPWKCPHEECDHSAAEFGVRLVDETGAVLPEVVDTDGMWGLAASIANPTATELLLQSSDCIIKTIRIFQADMEVIGTSDCFGATSMRIEPKTEWVSGAAELRSREEMSGAEFGGAITYWYQGDDGDGYDCCACADGRVD